MRIQLEVGDWSLDGHSQTKYVYIESNLSISAIVTAFQIGAARLNLISPHGHDTTYLNICDEYADSRLSRDEYARLVTLGILPPVEDSDYGFNQDGSVAMDVESYADLWLRVVAYANPTFVYTVESDTPEIHIGGYGLFR